MQTCLHSDVPSVNLHKTLLGTKPSSRQWDTQVSNILEYKRETHINSETDIVQNSRGQIKGIGRVLWDNFKI